MQYPTCLRTKSLPTQAILRHIILRTENTILNLIKPCDAPGSWQFNSVKTFPTANTTTTTLVLLRSVLGKPLQKNEPYSLTHVMFGAQLCNLCVHSSTSECKELNGKKNESSTISFIIYLLNLISVKICSLVQIVSRLFRSRRSVCCATLPLRS